MIYVLATITLAPGKRAEFLAEFKKNVPNVLAEQGCLEYVPAIDFETTIPAQGPPRPDVVTVVEKWSDLAALEAHLIAPHMISYRAKVKDIVQSVSLQVLKPG
jgi:quinol monooxygenase YgiN